MPYPWHSHAVPLIHTCHAAPHALLRQCRVLREIPRGSRKYPNCYSNSLTDRLLCSVLLPLFTVVGMDRCEEDWFASDNNNNLRGTPRGNRKKPNAGRYPTGRLSTAVLCLGLEKNGMVRAWHWRGMASVNQTRPNCVNLMGKTHSKPLAARHGRGRAWAQHAMCESALRVLATHSIHQFPLHFPPVRHRVPSYFNWTLSRPPCCWDDRPPANAMDRAAATIGMHSFHTSSMWRTDHLVALTVMSS